MNVGFRVYGFSGCMSVEFGMLPLILTVLNGYSGTPIFPIKDC